MSCICDNVEVKEGLLLAHEKAQICMMCTTAFCSNEFKFYPACGKFEGRLVHFKLVTRIMSITYLLSACVRGLLFCSS